MRNYILLLAGFISLCLSAAHGQSSGFLPMTGVNILDSTGRYPLDNATLCIQVTGQTAPISVQTNGSGHTTLTPVCTQVTSGQFAINVPDTSKTAPLHACVAVTVTDNTSGTDLLGSGYNCLQPASTGASWCTSSGCNFDLFKPNQIAQAIIQTGPPGPPGCAVGTSGCTGVVTSLNGQTGAVIIPSGSSVVPGLVKVDGTTITSTNGVISVVTPSSGNAGTSGPAISNIQIVISAGNYAPGCTTTPLTASMSGVVGTSVISVGYSSNPSTLVGWGASGGLFVAAYPSPSTTGSISYVVCNPTSATVSGASAITLNVGAQ